MSKPRHARIIGGCRGTFVGAIHRIAAELDAETARESATRSYPSYADMALAEAKRAGTHVIYDKPLTLTVAEGDAFVAVANRAGWLFAE